MQRSAAQRCAPLLAVLLVASPELFGSTENANSRMTPAVARAHAMFNAFVPQSLTLSVVNPPGAAGPAVGVQLQLQLNNNDMRLAPASLTRIPLVRCNPAAGGQIVCTAASP
jgi:hypothetical protein